MTGAAARQLRIAEEIETLALDAQAALARHGHHCVAPSDPVIAACAHVAWAGVLCYDRDHGVIRDRTLLDFASEWLAPSGTLP